MSMNTDRKIQLYVDIMKTYIDGKVSGETFVKLFMSQRRIDMDDDDNEFGIFSVFLENETNEEWLIRNEDRFRRGAPSDKSWIDVFEELFRCCRDVEFDEELLREEKAENPSTYWTSEEEFRPLVQDIYQRAVAIAERRKGK